MWEMLKMEAGNHHLKVQSGGFYTDEPNRHQRVSCALAVGRQDGAQSVSQLLAELPHDQH